MANFKADILEAISRMKETEEDIEKVYVGSLLDETYYRNPNTKELGFHPDPRNSDLVDGKCYDWEEVKEKFNYPYDDGYGGMDCHDIVIWTPNTIYYIHEYDGSTCFHTVSRNPPKGG